MHMDSISSPKHKTMYTLSNSKQSFIAIPENWERSTTVFTSNEVLSAYEMGKEEGMIVQQNLNQKILIEKITTNLKLATQIAEEFRLLLKVYHTDPHIRLRINSISSFDLAFVLAEEFYNSDDLASAYEQAHELRRIHSTDTFSIYIYLFPKTKSLSLSKMDADGFSMHYEPKSTKTTS
jgi:hypothetical protein